MLSETVRGRLRARGCTAGGGSLADALRGPRAAVSEDGTITGSTTITAGDQLTALWASMGRWFQIAGIFAFVMLLVLLVVALSSGDEEGMSWTTPALGLLAIAAWPLFIAWWHRRLAPEQKQVSYAIDDQQIV